MKNRILSLSKSEDFKSILNGKKYSNKYLTIFFKKIPGKNDKKLNIGFITKRKIGNAVKRNKIKRRLKNIMNDAIKNLDLNFAYSYLFISKKNLLNEKYVIIKKTIFKELEKIK
tara:strand:+ start:108 stop:449 length:342 start_codon:yes stop_codon:yes gene_type:complete